MPVTIEVQGSEQHLAPDSLNITQTLFQRSTADFLLPDKLGNLDVRVGEQVKVLEDEYLWFAGTITTVDATCHFGTPRQLHITAVDYSQLCDRRITFDRTWKNTPVNTIVCELVAGSLAGEGVALAPTRLVFASDGSTTVWVLPEARTTPAVKIGGTDATSTTTWNDSTKTLTLASAPPAGTGVEIEYFIGTVDLANVPAGLGASVADFSTKYEPLSDALTRLAQLVNCYWRIDYINGNAEPKQMVFKEFNVGLVIASLTNTSKHIVADSLQSKQSRDQYANHVLVTFTNYMIPGHDVFSGNGEQTEFDTSVELVTEPKVTVDGNYQSLGIEGVDTYGDVHWSPNSRTLKFANAPGEGSVIDITYTSKTTQSKDAFDGPSIDERKAIEGGSGLYQKVVNIDSEVTPEQAQAYADLILAHYLGLSTILTFDTDDIKVKPGERIAVSTRNVPADTYVVKSVKASYRGTRTKFVVRSSVEMVSGNLVMDGMETLGTMAGYQAYSKIAMKRETPITIVGGSGGSGGIVTSTDIQGSINGL